MTFDLVKLKVALQDAGFRVCPRPVGMGIYCEHERAINGAIVDVVAMGISIQERGPVRFLGEVVDAEALRVLGIIARHIETEPTS